MPEILSKGSKGSHSNRLRTKTAKETEQKTFLPVLSVAQAKINVRHQGPSGPSIKKETESWHITGWVRGSPKAKNSRNT